ncbi:MAG: hypothetical protein Q7J34_11740 [Bacteroidales bacterium]|nr:hypothetical protein [Bacteroidales bacterium]
MLFITAWAQEEPPAIEKAKAGSVKAIPIKYINKSNSVQHIRIITQLKPAWKLLNKNSLLVINPGDSLIKNLFFAIPRFARAGKEIIKVKIFSDDLNSILDSTEYFIEIARNYNIRAEILEAPDYVHAGEKKKISFSITNLSNCNVHASIDVFQPKDTLRYPIKLPPDTTIIVSKILNTRDIQSVSSIEFAFLKVFLDETDSVRVELFHQYEVILNANFRIDPYNRYPIEIKSRYVRQKIRDTNPDGFQIDISGGDFINERTDRYLAFRFRGPSQSGLSVMGLQEEYFLHFYSKQHQLVLGDFTYSLTQLTEPSRYGRGAQYAIKSGRWVSGAMVYKPRFSVMNSTSVAAYSTLNFYKKNSLKIAMLHKEGDSIPKIDILSVSTKISLTKNIEMGAEIASSKSDSLRSAFTNNLSFIHKRLIVSTNLIIAEKGFKGYFSDALQYSVNVGLPIIKTIHLNSSVHFNRKSVDYDSIQYKEPYSRHIISNLIFNFNQKTSLSLGGRIREYEDPLISNQFHFKEIGGGAQFNTGFNFFQLQVGSETGKTENFLNNSSQKSNYLDISSQISYAYDDIIHLSVFGKFSRNQRYNTVVSNQYYYGGNMSVRYSKYLYLKLSLQNNFEQIEYYRDRNLAQLDIEIKPHERHRIKIGGSYSLQREQIKSSSYYTYVEYSYSPGIITGKKKNIGSLKGRISTIEGAMVQGAIVMINGSTVLSGWDGSFAFPEIPAGAYLMSVRVNNEDINTIIYNPDDLTVKIYGGKTSVREIILSRSARIIGKFELKEDSVLQDGLYYQKSSRGIQFIVEATSGDETKRVLTKAEGDFIFTDLRPGQWNIKVYINGQNRDYVLENEYFTVNLKPGETEKLFIPLKPRYRKIKIIGSKQ